MLIDAACAARRALADTTGESRWTYATQGFDPEAADELSSIATPNFTGKMGSWLYHHPLAAPTSPISTQPATTSSPASALPPPGSAWQSAFATPISVQLP